MSEEKKIDKNILFIIRSGNPTELTNGKLANLYYLGDRGIANLNEVDEIKYKLNIVIDKLNLLEKYVKEGIKDKVIEILKERMKLGKSVSENYLGNNYFRNVRVLLYQVLNEMLESEILVRKKSIVNKNTGYYLLKKKVDEK